MNKNTRRLIFNAARGCLMAVSEAASSCTKSPASPSKNRRKLTRLRKTPKSSPFHPSNKPAAQSLRARPTPTFIVTGNNITQEAAQNTSTSSSFYEKKEFGLLSGGSGLSISIGKREQSTDQKNQSTTAAASTVGAINSKAGS